jgi:hypothetical protein
MKNIPAVLIVAIAIIVLVAAVFIQDSLPTFNQSHVFVVELPGDNGQHAIVLRLPSIVKIGGELFVKGTETRGWMSGRQVMTPLAHVQSITEIDSIEDIRKYSTQTSPTAALPPENPAPVSSK